MTNAPSALLLSDRHTSLLVARSMYQGEFHAVSSMVGFRSSSSSISTLSSASVKTTFVGLRFGDGSCLGLILKDIAQAAPRPARNRVGDPLSASTINWLFVSSSPVVGMLFFLNMQRSVCAARCVQRSVQERVQECVAIFAGVSCRQ
eukprot:m.385402 g.385402  ORF g.385402 m.385402 type:complete len:147 (-) comp56281_c0_seq10:13-453(-)